MGSETDISEESPVNPMAGLSDSWRETRGDRTRLERLIEVATGLHEPTRVSEVADAADCSTNFAGDKLDMLAQLGVLEQVADTPAQYRRDETHFRRLRARNLVAEHDGDLESAIETYRERDEKLQDRFGVESPRAVTWELLDDIEDPEALADAKRALSRWTVVRQRLLDLQRAGAIATTGDRGGESVISALDGLSDLPFDTRR